MISLPYTALRRPAPPRDCGARGTRGPGTCDGAGAHRRWRAPPRPAPIWAGRRRRGASRARARAADGTPTAPAPAEWGAPTPPPPGCASGTRRSCRATSRNSQN